MTQIRAHAIKEKGGSVEPFSYERAVGSHDVLVSTHDATDLIYNPSADPASLHSPPSP